MNEIMENVNWLAVGASAVLAFLLGWLWFSPALFGKKWAQGVGVELGDASNMPVAAMVTQAIGTFLLAWFVGVTAASGKLSTLILALVAFAVLAYSGGMFAKKSSYAIMTETSFWVAMVAIMVITHAVL